MEEEIAIEFKPSVTCNCSYGVSNAKWYEIITDHFTDTTFSRYRLELPTFSFTVSSTQLAKTSPASLFINYLFPKRSIRYYLISDLVQPI